MVDTSSATVLIANPSADVYGSDLQLLDSISGMTEKGWRVVVAVPVEGRLTEMMRARGAEVEVVDFPVVRRANLSPKSFAGLAVASTRSLGTLRRVIKRVAPDLVYVNTMTIPWWITAARLARTPVLCHVHEAEDKDGRVVLTALSAPLLPADAIIANSKAAVDAMCTVLPLLRKKIRLIYNGITAPAVPPTDPNPDRDPFKLVAVCRLSPRKAPDVALEALAQLRAQGRNVELEICGTPFEGYEWFEDQLRQRAAQPDLEGSVTFSGYVNPIWPALERSHAVVAPSLREPFGNAVIEGHLARRPVVASAALGHLETVIDGTTGLLVPPGDATALANAVARLMDDPELAVRLGKGGEQQAHERFSIGRYRAEIVDLVIDLVGRRARK